MIQLVNKGQFSKAGVSVFSLLATVYLMSSFFNELIWLSALGMIHWFWIWGFCYILNVYATPCSCITLTLHPVTPWGCYNINVATWHVVQLDVTTVLSYMDSQRW